MIFITVGTQLPFDRLILAIDEFNENKKFDIFAQVGPTSKSFTNIEFIDFLSYSETENYFKKADLIIAHAGMGSILTALKYQKPIIVVPRLASLGEHRNEHQLATIEWIRSLPGVTVAANEDLAIEYLQDKDYWSNGSTVSMFANKNLLDYIENFIKNKKQPKKPLS